MLIGKSSSYLIREMCIRDRVKALDSGISERAYATAVAAAMKAKSAIGSGRHRKNKKNVSSRGRGGGMKKRRKRNCLLYTSRCV